MLYLFKFNLVVFSDSLDLKVGNREVKKRGDKLRWLAMADQDQLVLIPKRGSGFEHLFNADVD
ncbi:hypothetical protein [Oryza sativa Japonica Group]|uniref:Uncharacterized protein n=1 Tax=Oryza sativa subsp. japonica TaxID=39947 RepID=Q5QLC4_ORYSJ|nr:hypothetical protein [Oryza sativa Japonica Group]